MGCVLSNDYFERLFLSFFHLIYVLYTALICMDILLFSMNEAVCIFFVHCVFLIVHCCIYFSFQRLVNLS